MLDVFLDKLEVDNADMLYVQHPSMVEVSWPSWSRTQRLDLRGLFAKNHHEQWKKGPVLVVV